MTPARGTKLVRESEIEAHLVKRVRAAGGLSYKFVSPGRSGVPDRLVILDGVVFFVEVKAPGGKLSALQDRELKRIRDAGINALVVWSKDDIDLIFAP